MLQYLKQTQPEVLEKGQALDKVATQLIIDGFLAYGWTLSELAETSGKLLEQLRLYVDISELALQQGTEEESARCNGAKSLHSISTTNRIDEVAVSSERGACYYIDNPSFGKFLSPFFSSAITNAG